MHSVVILTLLLGLFNLAVCFPVDGWTEDGCSKRKVIEMKSFQGHINSGDAHLDATDDCQMWRIQALPNATITIRFSDFMSGAFTCNIGAYVEMGPSPKSTLCGVPKLPFTYHSVRDHVWIKFVIPKFTLPIEAYFGLDYISELGTNCPARCMDGTCILQQWRCNGYTECVDSSDEMNCNKDTITDSVRLARTPSTTTKRPTPSPVPRYGCSNNELYCLNTSFVYTCLPAHRRCDGKQDCLRQEDETFCKITQNTTTPAPLVNPCDFGEIYCMVRGQGRAYRCLHNLHKCDGIFDCYDEQDENPAICRNQACNRRLEEPSGWFVPPFWGKQCSWVFHQLGSSPKSKVQLRPVFFGLEASLAEVEKVLIYDGPDATYPLIGQYDGLHTPPLLIESSSNWLYVVYQSVEEKSMAFNFTYQTKGTCLPGQIKCSQEDDCFEISKRCNGVWDCPALGSDELGCGRCLINDYYCGLQTGQCYHKEERCNGITRCSSKVDEINCTSVQCGSHNGTFLCDNRNCIYESWVCDQRDDCGDNSDEKNCGGSTKRVIIAAISGSMICALLLVILMGCSCKLYSLRVVDHRRIPRHETPMSRLYAEFLRRRAPPPYHEAMLTSRNFDEVQQEFLERAQQATNRTRRGRRSRSRNNQQNPADQDGDTNNNNEQSSDNGEGGDGNRDGGENVTNVGSGVTETENSNNVNIDRQSSTAELILSDNQTGSSDSEDSDISDDTGDNEVSDTNREAPVDDQSDEENILTSESLSTRWARATETDTLSDEECILEDNVSETPSMDDTVEPVRFSSSFRDSQCDSASVDTGSLSVNSIELPEITSSTLVHGDLNNENDSDFDKLDDDSSQETLPKPDNCSDRNVISGQHRLSGQRQLSQDSLDSEGSELLSDNDVPLLPLHNSSR